MASPACDVNVIPAFSAFALWVVAFRTRKLLAVCKLSGVLYCWPCVSRKVPDKQEFSPPYACWVVSAFQKLVSRVPGTRIVSLLMDFADRISCWSSMHLT